MNDTNLEIEESQVGVALAADNSATPYDLNELSANISDISFLVGNYCEKPTKRKKTRDWFLGSLINMLTEANEQLIFYIEDLKQSKCIEPFDVSSEQEGDDEFWKFIDMLCEEIKHDEAYQGLQEICHYLNDLSDTKKILLPINAEKMYNELVRLGMPDTGGFSKEHFRKQYFRKDLCQ